MTTRLLSIFLLSLISSGCAHETQSGLEEIVLDHRCPPDRKVKSIELKSIAQAKSRRIIIESTKGLGRGINFKVSYPPTKRKLPIAAIFLSRDGIEENISLPDMSSEKVEFSIDRDAALASSFNLSYFEQSYCTSIFSYSIKLGGLIEKES